MPPAVATSLFMFLQSSEDAVTSNVPCVSHPSSKCSTGDKKMKKIVVLPPIEVLQGQTDKYGRRKIRCTLCYENMSASLLGKSTSPPAIATESGTSLHSEVIETHLASAMHAAAASADRFRNLSASDRQRDVRILQQFAHCNAHLATQTGQKMIEVYADAKKGSTGWSWPARHVAHLMSQSFKANEPHEPYKPPTGHLTYVNPPTYREFLLSIVEAELSKVQEKIGTSLALSLRVDGSVDLTQLDNKHCLIKIVDKNGDEDTLFLGFAEPHDRGTRGYVAAVKEACEKVMKWDQLLNKLSSIVTDGESMNTGVRQSLWTELDKMRADINLPPLLKIWCAVHRSSLAWSSA